MGVDEAGDHQAAVDIDHLSVRGAGRECRSDGGDDVVADEDVAVGQIAELRVDGDDVAARDEKFSGHDVASTFVAL
jgi:hypothetical protein